MDERQATDATDGRRLGDYALIARLARHAHADVYDAVHAHTGAPRLLYVLRPRAMEDHALVHRVVCEVDAARWLRHPVTAKADGYGDTPSKRLYVAVERAPGRTLRELLDAGERLAPWRVARLASRLVEALDEAHAVGLAHGRLTPDAVVLAPDAGDAGAPMLTLTGLGAGAVAHPPGYADAERPYVAPEQLAGADADVRSDVFGLASLLHHLLLGAAPGRAAEPGPVADAPRPADVLAAARHPDPRRRPAGVKLLWEELLAANAADAAQAPASAPAAADALGAAPAATFELDLLLEPALRTPPVPLRAMSPDREPVVRPDLPAFAATSPAPAPAYAASLAARAPEPRFERPLPPALAREPELLHEPAPAPSLVPSRRRRALVAIFWCVAVPAVAAALSWPLGQDAPEPRAGTIDWEPEAAPPSAPLSPDAFRIPYPDTAARRADTLPTLPAVELPEVEVPMAPARPAPPPLVRPEEFSKRLTPRPE
ncbi:hypothetical protein [Roseisolibacter sp. H3M3-2]|uniref:protein kinase domain-containing protein n=1 Tax=Roseisolibacter sp. H3M3-2 TaxID=3031323 RepID=UPI0023DC7ED2|nr:hypothetical protein [Roseisolibacter sp. H3M3-2]MDF1505342.1 hypothetical protein [Roseisolibacter sp. H3M3-2]